MSAVGSRSQGKRKEDSGRNAVEVGNMDGAVRDEDVFAIGDEDDEDRGEGDAAALTPPPAYVELGDEVSRSWSTVQPSSGPAGARTVSSELGHETETSAREGDVSQQQNDETQASSTAPSKYYIKSGDTLTGIALRFGVDVRPVLASHPRIYSDMEYTLNNRRCTGPYSLPSKQSPSKHPHDDSSPSPHS